MTDPLPPIPRTEPVPPAEAEAQDDQIGEEVPPGEKWDFEEDPDGEREEEEYPDPQEVFDNWVLSLTRDQRKMLSVILYESVCNCQGMSKMNAAQQSVLLLSESVGFTVLSYLL